MVLPLLIILPILGFAIMLVVSWLSTVIPFFGNFLWALILFVMAIALAYFGIGKQTIIQTKTWNLNLSSILILPALALIFMALIGVNISALLGSVTPLIASITPSSLTGGVAAEAEILPGMILTVIVAAFGAIIGAMILTWKPVAKKLHLSN